VLSLNFGLLGYSIAAVLYLLFAVLLLSSRRGRIEGVALLVSVGLTALWSLSSAFLLYDETKFTLGGYYFFEVAKNLAWFVFLYQLLKPLRRENGEEGQLIQRVPIAVFSLSMMLLLIELLLSSLPPGYSNSYSVDLQMVGHLGLAIAGLIMVEQLFRNTRVDHRWAVKYLYLGIGASYAYDFFLYADALLFKEVNFSLWTARGYIYAFVVPMLAISAARNPAAWSTEIFISRQVVFHSTAIFGAGLYLFGMSVAGYYIRTFGGDWGTMVQVVFFFCAIVLLLMILFSISLRARLRVFLSKHFFSNKYDYREEWLKLIQTLAGEAKGEKIREQVIKAVAAIVESTQGALWIRNEKGDFHCVKTLQMSEQDEVINSDSSMIKFFDDRDWIIHIDEYHRDPDLYYDLTLPKCLDEQKNIWLIIPIRHQHKLYGFLTLGYPQSPRQINWEDRDLLKTACQQAASYLVLLEANEALSEAQQFEAFNRLSAFVVHDLKNLIAQLDLVVKNSVKHKNNPAFMEDAIDTVGHAVNKMNRLLKQLRKGRFEAGGEQIFDLKEALGDVVMEQSGFSPLPVLESEEGALKLVADYDRFVSVMGHLVRNAQEATSQDGYVTVKLKRIVGTAIIDIVDNGSGMDALFIKDRLFRPFETTKGNAGMGIGVYESREFIRSLGGNIQVKSRVGVGTTFTIELGNLVD
jgi:putative PEP-CTERM system histidine kinase